MTTQKEPTSQAVTEAKPVEKWPLPSRKVTERFVARHPTWKLTTLNYQRTQMRLAFLFDHPEKDRWAVFLEVAKTRGISAATTAAYWVAHLTAKAAMGESPTSEDKKGAKHLMAQAERAQPAHPQPMTIEQANRISQCAESDTTGVSLAILFGFVAGQRISDVLQLHEADVTIDCAAVVVTVRRGKVVPTIGPYTLALGIKTPVGNHLLQRKKIRRNKYLFSDGNTDDERGQLALEVRLRLAELDPGLEARSVRRGGLQAMAAQGVPLQQIIKMSKHSTIPMLMRYLDWGAKSSAHVNEVAEIIDAQQQLLAEATTPPQQSSTKKTGTQEECYGECGGKQ